MAQPVDRRRLLAAVSAAQLATGVAGMVVALRRRRPYDVFWMHGRDDAIARDSVVKGTALSAPVLNLLAQAALTAVVARRPSWAPLARSAAVERSRWRATWANGSCGGACDHPAGTPSSRRWWSRAWGWRE